MSRRCSQLFAVAAVVVCSLATVIIGQDQRIWNGAYTEAQVERGRKVSATHCAECHSEGLTGESGPPLVGDVFMLHWEGQSVERLFRKIQGTMPPESAQTMSDQERLDVVALILKLNGFPAGSSELMLKPELSGFVMIGREGLAAPRNGAIVSVIGCLAKDINNDWMLNNATEPRLTTLDKASTQDTKTDSATLGTKTVRLLSAYPDPAPHQGHKMEAKGLLVKDATGDRVNVMSLEMLHASCAD
jgi:S-disulfanyl-L-cysteine oxidoreductase SoxD